MGPSATANQITFRVYQDNTQIKIDTNKDGSFDTYLSGSKGETLDWKNPVEGAFIEVVGKVDTYYHYGMYDYGAYEDGGLGYTLLEESLLSTEYYLPFVSKVTSILSIQDMKYR
jgi:hypothetical protein